MSGALRRSVVLLATVCVLVGVAPAGPASAADQYRDAEWWLSALHLTQAWQVSTGKGVTIGLLDSGVDTTHPDLTGVVSASVNFTGHSGFDGNPDPIDPNYDGHGTSMAVDMAGRGHGPGHAQGIIGSAPGASVLSIETGGTTDAEQQDHDGIVWAVDHGAKVINMSFLGGVNVSDIAYAEAHDVVLVAGAGNDGQDDLGQPANFFGVVAVAGIDPDLKGDPTSTYGGPVNFGGVASTGGVAVAAPDSAKMPHALLVKDGEYAMGPGGTSDSTAIVSGIVALIRAKFPHMDAANVINRLITTAYRPKGSGAYDAAHGFGVPDAYKALTAKVPSVCENPLGSEIGVAPDGEWPLNPGPWQGGWQSILKHNNLSAYEPNCETQVPPATAPPSTAAPATTAPATSSAPATASAPSSGSTSPAAGLGSGPGPSSSSATPVGLIAGLSGLGVLLLAGILVYATRIRPRRT